MSIIANALDNYCLCLSLTSRGGLTSILLKLNLNFIYFGNDSDDCTVNRKSC